MQVTGGRQVKLANWAGADLARVKGLGLGLAPAAQISGSKFI